MKKKKKYSGFTLIEMLIVLLVIAVLVLLFVPNIAGKSDKINTEGEEAFKQVVTTQVELYVLEKSPKESDKITLELLAKDNYLTAKQVSQATSKYGYTADGNLRSK